MKSWIEGEWRQEGRENTSHPDDKVESWDYPNDGATVKPLTWVLCTLGTGAALGLLILSPIGFFLLLFFIWAIFINPNGD